MANLEALLDVPQIQFNSYTGFSGHLSRGLHVLPDGQEVVYSIGSHVAFLKINEKTDRELTNKVVPLTRKVGGGAAPPRARAFGGTTTAPNMSRVLTTTTRKPLLEAKESIEVPQQDDTNVIVPGSLIRPTLVSGHKQQISAMCLSLSGKYLVTGTAANPQQSAEVIVWDVTTKQPLCIQNQHKGSVTDIVISPDESYFCTMGIDNQILFYPLTEVYKFPVYQPIAGRNIVNTAKPLVSLISISPSNLLVGGDDYLNFITVDLLNRTLSDNQIRIPLKRKFTCFAHVGDFVYAGTEQGDVIKIDPSRYVALQACPSKKPFVGVVTSIVGNDQDNLLVSTNASKIYLIRTDSMTPVSSNEVQCQTGAAQSTSTTSALQISVAQLNSPSPLAKFVNCNAAGVSALSTCPCSKYVYCIGPNALARINKTSLEVRLLQTATPTIVSPHGISSVTVPYDTNRIYVTACGSFVSIWSAQTGAELLRINVPNIYCTCVKLSPDGSQIISGWSDGCLRSFAPQTGRNVFVLQNVHAGGITAFDLSQDGAFAFTGGADAKICVVDICAQKVLQITSGHRGYVTAVIVQHLASGLQELVTSCNDSFVQNFHIIQQGSQCSIRPVWNSRAEGNVKGVAELCDGSQIIAVGSGGLTWFNCGKNAGAVIRALPLISAGTSLCKEERGEVAKIVVGCVDGRIFVFDWDTGKVEQQLQVNCGEIKSVCVEQGVVFAGGLDGGIVSFDLWPENQ